MNKYAAIGLIREAIKGRRIVVVTGTRTTEERFAFAELEALLENAPEVRRITRLNGASGFQFDGAGCLDIRRQPSDLRGRSYDVIYLDSEIAHEISYDEIRAHLMPALATSDRGEIVRA